MTGWWVLGTLLVALLFVFVAWCSWTATRLDRLQVRCEATRAIVLEQLRGRSSLTLELPASAGPGASSSDAAAAGVLLAHAAARRARDARGSERWVAESELSRALRAVGAGLPGAEAALSAVRDCERRASLTRRIHNDGAAAALALHRRRRVRWFRLAGRSKPPEMIEYDDGSR